jgi:hypothetical protein
LRKRTSPGSVSTILKDKKSPVVECEVRGGLCAPVPNFGPGNSRLSREVEKKAKAMRECKRWLEGQVESWVCGRRHEELRSTVQQEIGTVRDKTKLSPAPALRFSIPYTNALNSHTLTSSIGIGILHRRDTSSIGIGIFHRHDILNKRRHPPWDIDIFHKR